MRHGAFSVCVCILWACAVVSGVLGAPANAEERYGFERLWPTLPQPWYFQPYDVDVDASGHVILLDAYTGTIHKYTADGRLITKWGGKGSEPGRLRVWPTPREGEGGLATDRQGNVYVADTGNRRVQKFDPNGGFLLEWGEAGSGPGGFADPWGIAVDAVDNVYVVDVTNGSIQKFDSQGGFLAQLDGLNQPVDVAVAPDGRLLVLERNPARVQRIEADLSGIYDQWGVWGAAAGELYQPIGIEVDDQGRVYITDNGSDRIQAFSLEGDFLALWGEYGFADGRTSDPKGLAVDGKGTLYVCDAMNYRVQKFTADGRYLSKWYTAGSEPGAFFRPTGVAVDADGLIFVCDRDNHRIQKFDANGAFLSQWGGKGPAAGALYFPMDVAVDPGGAVYVADSGNDRIQRFDANGHFLNQWPCEGKIDGLATTADGLLLVADSENFQIRAYQPDGTLISSWGDVRAGPSGPFDRWDVAADSNGHVYVADRLYGGVHKLDPNGTPLTRWTTLGGYGVGPVGIAVDASGSVYVTHEDGRLKKFDGQGNLVAQWSSEGVDPGQCQYPLGIAVDAQGRVIVAETFNHRVQVFRPMGDAKPGKAVIVAGGGPYPGNNLWEATQSAANFAYRALAYQGFTKQSICYLSADTDLDLDANGLADDVDGEATNEALADALTDWASDAHRIVVYLVDHGGPGRFRMSDTQTLSATDLGACLDDLQQSSSADLLVVYDACESGTFLPALSGTSRAVLTSTSPGEQAKFVTQGAVSFSAYFWTHVFRGEDVTDAFDLSRHALAASFDDQTPLLDADGNGLGNEPSDRDRAAGLTIGNGRRTSSGAPMIETVDDPRTLSGTTSAVLTASGVTDPDGVARVWAVIRPPDWQNQDAPNPVLDLPSVDLTPQGGGTYQAVWSGFDTEGTYTIALYARDRFGNTCIPELTTVSVENPLPRKAVVIAGGPETSLLWPAVETMAIQAYEALRGQGYADRDITFLSPVTVSRGVDGTPVAGNVAFALTEWAERTCQDLVVFLVGRGVDGGFVLNEEETLSFEQLDSWLDALQASIPGRVSLICDASYAGGALPRLTPPPGKDRVVLASTGAQQTAAFTTQGELSFSRYFWRQVTNGMDVRAAFLLAKNAIFYAGGQNAQMDDNGDGLYTKEDGQAAARYCIGSGILLAGDAPVIGTVSSGGTLYGSERATLSVADVTTTGTIDRVWAVVSSPTASAGSGPIPCFELAPQADGRFEGTVSGLTRYGRHGIAVFAMDTRGDISVPVVTSVWQDAQDVTVKTGDLDGDGQVTAADLVLALQALSGRRSPIRADYVASGLDANGNGTLGLEEAIDIHGRASGLRGP